MKSVRLTWVGHEDFAIQILSFRKPTLLMMLRPTLQKLVRLIEQLSLRIKHPTAIRSDRGISYGHAASPSEVYLDTRSPRTVDKTAGDVTPGSEASRCTWMIPRRSRRRRAGRVTKRSRLTGSTS